MATPAFLNHRDTETQRHRTQRHRTVAPSQARRRKDAKDSRRHRRESTQRRRGASPSPHVTLSEGVRRPSRRVPRGYAGCFSPQRGDQRSFVLRASRLHRTPPRRRAGFIQNFALPRNVGATKTLDPMNSRLRGRLEIGPLRQSCRRITSNNESGCFLSCIAKAEPLCPGHDEPWDRLDATELVLRAAGRFHGGGGRRPSPTPPPEDQIRVIREIRVPIAMCDVCDDSAVSPAMCDGSICDVCDVSVPLCASPCLCGSTAMDAMAQIKCDAAMTSCAMPSRLCVFALAASATSATLR